MLRTFQMPIVQELCICTICTRFIAESNMFRCFMLSYSAGDILVILASKPRGWKESDQITKNTEYDQLTPGHGVS